MPGAPPCMQPRWSWRWVATRGLDTGTATMGQGGGWIDGWFDGGKTYGKTDG